MPKRPYEILLIGAGNRGAEVYGKWIRSHPDQLKITAVAEPVDLRRETAAKDHAIPPSRQFTGWEEALSKGRLADAAIICTLDQQHTLPALKALECGYDVLLEKPMASRLSDCVTLVQAAERHGKLLQIAHVLRYTDFFQRVYHIVQSGALGQIITVSHRENVSAWHMAHSYVRGNWRRTEDSSPMILAKSCHDLDILYWILSSRPKSLSSVGGLKHFRPENAPSGAPQRCLDGCPAAATCPFYAPAVYIDLEPIYIGLSHAQNRIIRLTGHMMQRSPGVVRAAATIIPPLRQITDYTGWPRSIITDQPSDPASVYEALRSGPYGRCVYHCDNDVVDHQIVLMELENGVSVSFTMHGHSFEECRTIRIDGSQATLLGKFGWNQTFIEIHKHRGGKYQRIEMPNNIEQGGHGGGDSGLMEHFVKALDGVHDATLTDARSSLESHLMAFAAEQARTTGSVIDMPTFRAEVEKTTLFS
ncbi:MAG TPA: gfo/Idh/MocA family oxidoreductase [Anaerolineaceae bacterium]|nr:gfo/Idh/MocA family oxidoreductase [Anaerolineaceae bacterium]